MANFQYGPLFDSDRCRYTEETDLDTQDPGAIP